jgi:hypothetical protein
MLTKLKEEEYGIDNVVQDEPEMSDEQRAVLAANNSGLDLSSVPTFGDRRGGDQDTGRRRRERDEQVQTRGSARKDRARPNGWSYC